MNKIRKTFIYALSFSPALTFFLIFDYLSKVKDIFNGVAIGDDGVNILGSPLYISFYVLISLSLLASSLLGISLYKKTNDKKWLWALILNGFISIWIFSAIKIWVSKKNKKFVWRKPFFSYLTLVMIFVASASMLFGTFFFLGKSMKKSIDDPSHLYSEKISFSTNPSTPNTIEIFYDGLSFENVRKYITPRQDLELEDFYMFPKFVTTAFFTTGSIGKILHSDGKYKEDYGYTPNFENIINNEFKSNSSVDEQYNYVGNINLGGGHNYYQSWSGNPKVFKKNNPSFTNVINWREAQEKMNDYNVSPEFAPYKLFTKDASGSFASKPSHTFMADHISHHPYHLTAMGNYTSFEGSIKNSYLVLNHFLVDLKRKLTSIKGQNGMNAYKNTSILIYGDHNSHEIKSPIEFEPFDSSLDRQKNESCLMLKPAYNPNIAANSSGHMKIVQNKAIFAKFFRRITHKIYAEHSDPIDFIMKNSNFNVGRKFMTYKYWNKTHVLTHYIGNKLVQYTNKKLVKMGAIDPENGWMQHLKISYSEFRLKEGLEWDNDQGRGRKWSKNL